MAISSITGRGDSPLSTEILGLGDAGRKTSIRLGVP